MSGVTIKPVVTYPGVGDGSAIKFFWETVTKDDTCAPASVPEHTVKSLQVTGTFDSASVALQGSNDGTNYAALNAVVGTPLAIAAAGIKSPIEHTLFVKPTHASGSTSQDIDITLLAVRPTPLRT